MYQEGTKYVHNVFSFFFLLCLDIRTIALLYLGFLTLSVEIECVFRCCCGLNCIPPKKKKRYFQILTPNKPVNTISFANRVFADIIKLRSLGWSPIWRRGKFGHRHEERTMPCENTNTEEIQPCEGRGRDWSFADTSQGITGLSEPEEARKGPLLKALEEAWHCPHLDFRCLASTTVR